MQLEQNPIRSTTVGDRSPRASVARPQRPAVAGVVVAGRPAAATGTTREDLVRDAHAGPHGADHHGSG